MGTLVSPPGIWSRFMKYCCTIPKRLFATKKVLLKRGAHVLYVHKYILCVYLFIIGLKMVYHVYYEILFWMKRIIVTFFPLPFTKVIKNIKWLRLSLEYVT